MRISYIKVQFQIHARPQIDAGTSNNCWEHLFKVSTCEPDVYLNPAFIIFEAQRLIDKMPYVIIFSQLAGIEKP